MCGLDIYDPEVGLCLNCDRRRCECGRTDISGVAVTCSCGLSLDLAA